MYNLTNLTAGNGLYDVFNFANDVTTGGVTVLFVMALFLIILVVLHRYRFTASLAAASFVCFIVSLMLSFGHLLAFIYPLGFFALLAYSMLYSYITD